MKGIAGQTRLLSPLKSSYINRVLGAAGFAAFTEFPLCGLGSLEIHSIA